MTIKGNLNWCSCKSRFWAHNSVSFSATHLADLVEQLGGRFTQGFCRCWEVIWSGECQSWVPTRCKTTQPEAVTCGGDSRTSAITICFGFSHHGKRPSRQGFHQQPERKQRAFILCSPRRIFCTIPYAVQSANRSG